jgi:hypothetical protein
VSVVESLRALPGEGDPAAAADVRFTDGRVVILFCPICGGLACGALSADIRVTNSTVEWRDLSIRTTTPRVSVFRRFPSSLSP